MACLSTASVLLVLFRTLGPVQVGQLATAAGLVGKNPGTIRSHIHYLRKALGNSSIQQTDDTYMLTMYGRMKVEAAFRDLSNTLANTINPPTTPKLTVVAQT